MKKPLLQQAPKGWDAGQKLRWYADTVMAGSTRDYECDVVARLQRLPANTHVVECYGTVNTPHKNYDLYRVTVGDLFNGKPTLLIVGGIHGYEPSGVEAALRNQFNAVVYPCVSPWAYEYDHRWTWQAEDPNRMFARGKGFEHVQECQLFMDSIEQRGIRYAVALDLHETSDRDIELRQMRAARFGTDLASDFRVIPQGFYLTLTKGADEREDAAQMDFGQHIIRRVREVSPLAPEPEVMGKRNMGGIILAPTSEGLSRHYLAKFADRVGITEVYPDHPTMSPETSVLAQQACIHGALDYMAR